VLATPWNVHCILTSVAHAIPLRAAFSKARQPEVDVFGPCHLDRPTMGRALTRQDELSIHQPNYSATQECE
jgi:hypothetical protein